METSNTDSFGLVIIESLPEFTSNGEKQVMTGTNLHESLIKYKKFQEPELTSRLHKVANKKEFFEVLEDLILEVKNNNFLPILQIEAHGCDSGIQLASQEMVNWEELFAKTVELNTHLRNRLLINLALCSGTTLIGNIDPSQRAPFLAVIGTMKEIDSNSLQQAFEEFYDHFFFTFEISESVTKMNNKNTSAKFNLITSEFCFDQIVNPDRDTNNFQSRVNQVAVLEKASSPEFANTDFKEVIKVIDQRMRKILSDIKDKKDHFVMNDLKN